MEELKKFQRSTFDTIARRRLVEDQDTILELADKIQELQNEINCMNDSRDFQDVESVRSGNSPTLPVDQCHSHLIQFLTSGSQEPTILSRIMPTFSLLVFEMTIFRKFDSKCDGILLSMTKIPSDDILEGLYKLRIRVSEKIKTVLELYDLETHQKKLGPDYHRLKAMVKRSIEQEIRSKNFGARNGNYEKNAVFENQGTKQRGQRILGDCWRWESNGQCSRGEVSVTISINVRK